MVDLLVFGLNGLSFSFGWSYWVVFLGKIIIIVFIFIQVYFDIGEL